MKKKSLYRLLLLIGLTSIPTLALAQVAQITGGFQSFETIIRSFNNTIVKSLAALFASAAMVAFFFGLVKYIIGIRNGDTTANRNGQQFMMWGLIALFVMFSVWGIITYAQRIFGIEGKTNIIIPEIMFQSGSGSTNNGGVTNSPGSNGGAQVFTCPAGTPGAGRPYYNQSDYRLTCVDSGSTGTSGQTGSQGSDAQTVYRCPDGTPYYNPSDYRITCTQNTQNNPSSNTTGTDPYANGGPN